MEAKAGTPDSPAAKAELCGDKAQRPKIDSCGEFYLFAFLDGGKYEKDFDGTGFFGSGDGSFLHIGVCGFK